MKDFFIKDFFIKDFFIFCAVKKGMKYVIS